MDKIERIRLLYDQAQNLSQNLLELEREIVKGELRSK